MSRTDKIEPVFLTTAELAKRWAMSPRSLEGWRDKGIGIVWHRLNGGAVRYHINDVEECERRWRIGAFVNSSSNVTDDSVSGSRS